MYMLKTQELMMKTHYSNPEFLEWLQNSLQEHLDNIYGKDYTRGTHIEDLLITTDAFVSAITNFVTNCPKRG